MEIEKKYLVRELPDLTKYQCNEIEQGYLTRRPVLRIRKKDDDYIFTYKSRIEAEGEAKDLCVCDEVELPLTREAYEKLRGKTEGHLIRKTRYLIPLTDEASPGGKLTAELDVFHDRLEGLIFAEVEFPDERTALRFVPPAWFGKDVTSDKRYRNGHLSELDRYEKFI